MDHILSPQMTQWLMHDGYIALFVLLALGIIALPIPEESLMILSGYFIAHGKLPLIPTLLAAYAGSICGITVSYLLGVTAGHYLLVKYGYLLGISEHKIKKVHDWFGRIGKWALFIGYFILGIRHLTGYIAGSTRLCYRTFALFAYTGAIFWASSFIALGYFFNNQIEHFIALVPFNELILFIIAFSLLYLAWRLFKLKRRANLK